MTIAPATDAFQRTWARTDDPVSAGEASRTWMWGPEAFTDGMTEPYVEAPGGERTVQYFDKSRMEDSAYRADGPPWDVTNGLLVVELMTGRMQVGDDQFEEREPANVNIAGDAGDVNGMRYRIFAEAMPEPPHPEGEAIIAQAITYGGSPSTPSYFGHQDDPSLADYGVTAEFHVSATNHRVASVFWDFLNSGGTIYEDGQYLEDNVFPTPFYATGYPITEAYWTLAVVGGTEKMVLLQCFERRCLTYTPDNPEGWQVEAGNVGLHYYQWRYGQTEPPGDEAPADLECIALNYPCSMAESSAEALDQMFQYGEEMVQMMEAGTSMPDLLDWIGNQPGVVDSRGSDSAIRFRVENGTPAWVFDGRTFGIDANPGSDAESLDPGSLSQAGERLPQQVVGKDYDGDGMIDEKPKKALILSPYQWEFEPYDASVELAELFSQTRGYDEAGNVEFYRNEKKGDQNVKVSHFANWDEFDVVYVASHGGELCSREVFEWDCDTAVLTGIPYSRATAQGTDVTGANPTFTGYVEFESGNLGLSNDYFRSEYGLDGIQNTIIYLDSCDSYHLSGSLPALLAGSSSVAFGWDFSIGSGRAEEVANLIFSEAVSRGTPIGELFNSHLASSINDGRADTNLRVKIGAEFESGGDLRIRETVTLLHPLTEEMLTSEDPVPIIGEVGDAEDDQLPVVVEVDGVDDAPGEFVVHFRINGEDIPQTYTLNDAEFIRGGLGDPETGPSVYLLERNIPLGFPVQPEQEIEIMVWVELPEGGETKHTVAPPASAPVLEFFSVIEYESPHAAVEAESVISAEMPLVYTEDLRGFEPQTYDLVYENYRTTVANQPCELVADLHSGTIELVDSAFEISAETGKIASLVPQRVILRPNDDTYAITTIHCPTGSFTVPGQDIHWFAGFVIVHEPEIDQFVEGLAFRDWEAGSGEVYAETRIERSRSQLGLTVDGETTLTIREP